MVDVLAEVNVETPGEQVAAAEALKAVIPANHEAAISRESLVQHLQNPHFLDFNGFWDILTLMRNSAFFAEGGHSKI